MNNTLLEIKNLHASVENTEILRGVNLSVRSGEIHALMGPNGSGKSTLSAVLMGHPNYTPTSGDALLNAAAILDMSPDERAHAGLFLAFQYPVAVPGVPVISFLRAAYNAKHPDEKLTVAKFRKLLNEQAEKLQINIEFIDRPVNEGFSGGEKRKWRCCRCPYSNRA